MNCSIVEIEGKYLTQPYAWAFPKHSPYFELFDFYITEVSEKGQWEGIKDRHEAPPQVCLDMSGQPIEFANCFTAFLTLIYGFLLGLVLLFFENLFRPSYFRRISSNWIISRKDDTDLSDKTQLHFTIFRQRKLINRMKLMLEMNQRRLKKCRSIKQFSKENFVSKYDRSTSMKLD